MSRPKVDAITAVATATATNPAMLPLIRTPKTIMAKANDTASVNSATSAPLAALPRSSVMREIGALRSRFHRPR